MPITHQYSFAWNGQGGGTIPVSVTLQGDAEDNRVIVMPDDNPGPINIPLALTKNKMVGIFITSDRAVRLLTNSSGAPQDTIDIPAGGFFVWYVGSGVPNPFANNVTTTYWEDLNPSDGEGAVIQIKTLSNF